MLVRQRKKWAWIWVGGEVGGSGRRMDERNLL